MRLIHKLLIAGLVAVLVFSLVIISCAGKRKEIELQLTDDDTTGTTAPAEEVEAKPEKPKPKEEVEAKPEKPKKESEPKKRSLGSVPNYGLFADSLKYYERKLGVEFYKNKKGQYIPFSANSWSSFSIADRTGQCLYDVEVVGVQKLGVNVLLDMDISRGPCGLKYPDADVAVVERVSVMEGSVVSSELAGKKKGGFLCSDKRFLQKALQVPFDLDFGGKDLEQSIQRIAEQITNPMDLSFGDVVFFDSYPDEPSIGIYVGYGAISFNSCFGTKIHEISSKNRYRVYRLFTGFNWTQYKIHQGKFMQDYLGTPK